MKWLAVFVAGLLLGALALWFLVLDVPPAEPLPAPVPELPAPMPGAGEVTASDRPGPALPPELAGVAKVDPPVEGARPVP
ncbi:MAG TPA: hypothetical protein VMN03_00215, partial [Burkholderiales bacterium]|nr:hypothetical protein [Burkholderiales bacterium]